MNIFHGSDVIVSNPKILKSNRLLDFGIGFYTTSNEEQAIRWADKVSLRNKSKNKYLSTYQFNIKEAKEKLHIIEFTSPNEKWLDFITANRRGRNIGEEYDIVIGPVADDNVYMTVKLFETDVLSREEAIRRLKVVKLFDQILFHTNRALEFCSFRDYIDLGGEKNG